MKTWSAERQRCMCGHARVAHEHFRRGSDCAICGQGDCRRFRWADAPLRRLRRGGRLGDVAAVGPVRIVPEPTAPDGGPVQPASDPSVLL